MHISQWQVFSATVKCFFCAARSARILSREVQQVGAAHGFYDADVEWPSVVIATAFAHL